MGPLAGVVSLTSGAGGVSAADAGKVRVEEGPGTQKGAEWKSLLGYLAAASV